MKSNKYPTDARQSRIKRAWVRLRGKVALNCEDTRLHWQSNPLEPSLQRRGHWFAPSTAHYRKK
jgi:hypothetical protein